MHNTRAALAAGVFAAALVSDFTGIRCPLGNGGHAPEGERKETEPCAS